MATSSAATASVLTTATTSSATLYGRVLLRVGAGIRYTFVKRVLFGAIISFGARLNHVVGNARTPPRSGRGATAPTLIFLSKKQLIHTIVFRLTMFAWGALVVQIDGIAPTGKSIVDRHLYISIYITHYNLLLFQFLRIVANSTCST